MSKKAYYQVEGEQPRALLETWIRDLIAAEYRIGDYMRDIGATGAFRFSFEKPTSFTFAGNRAPEGWTKPKGRGASHPLKRNTAEIERLDAIPWPESISSLVGREFSLPTRASFTSPQDGRPCHRGLNVGMTSFSLHWTTTEKGTRDIVLVAPDYAAQIEGFGDVDPADISYTPEGTTPDLPEGFRRITDADVDLLFGAARVIREREEAAAIAAGHPADPFGREDLPEAMGFRIATRDVFEAEATPELQQRARDAATPELEHAWVIWDPEDTEEGLVMASDSESVLRFLFSEHARRGQTLPPPPFSPSPPVARPDTEPLAP